jgi:hypothetical protein
MASIVSFEGSNVQDLKVYEAEDNISGLHFVLNLTRNGSVCIDVFYSRHCLGAYSQPPTLQLTANCSEGPAAIDAKAFHSFFKANIGLLKSIQKGSTFVYSEASHSDKRILSEKARVAEGHLAEQFEIFVDELEWIDTTVVVEDIEDLWTDSALAEVITADMTEDEAVAAVRKKQLELSSIYNVIVGDPELMAQDFYYLHIE